MNRFVVATMLACGCGVGGGVVRAQSAPIPPTNHVFLPPSYGTTALSAEINAEAAYVASLGDYLVSEGIARRHHAEAQEHEIRNSLLWLQTYFDRKELNREYWLKHHPPHLDRKATVRKQTERRIYDLPEVARSGNVTDELNWMLHEVASSTMANEYLSESNPAVGSSIDQPLGEDDVAHIHLTDGGREGGKLAVFRADDAQVLSGRWPIGLRGPEFDEERKAFERERDRAVQELRDKSEVSYATQQALFEAVDALATKFTAEYPGTRLTDSSTIRSYNVAKRFLKSLAAGAYRIVETSDARLIDGSYRFRGTSLVQLVGHLCRYGLEFAPPEPGDEGTYQRLFNGLRQICLDVRPEQFEE